MLGWERPDLFYMLPCQFNVQVFVDIDKSEVTNIFFSLICFNCYSIITVKSVYFWSETNPKKPVGIGLFFFI